MTEKKITSIVDDYAAINRRLAKIKGESDPLSKCLYNHRKGICQRPYCGNGARCEYEDRNNDDYEEDDSL